MRGAEGVAHLSPPLGLIRLAVMWASRNDREEEDPPSVRLARTEGLIPRWAEVVALICTCERQGFEPIAPEFLTCTNSALLVERLAG